MKHRILLENFRGNGQMKSVSRVMALLLASSMVSTYVPPAMADDLTDALVSTYNTNPDIAAQRANVRANDEGVAQALSGWRPTVQVTSSYGWQGTKTSTVGIQTRQHHNPADAIASITQPIFNGWGTVYATQQAEHTVLFERQNLVQTEQTALQATVQAFSNVVRDAAILDLNTSNQKVLERQLQATKDRFEVGEITKTDVSQAIARLQRAKAARDNSEGILNASKATFQRHVGMPPKEGMKLPPKPEYLPQTEEEAMDIAMNNNPQLKAAQFIEAATKDSIGVATAQLLPSVSATGSYAYAWDQNTNDDRTESAAAVINLTVPIYAAGNTYSVIRQAKQNHNRRIMQVENTRRSIAEGVSAAWATYIAAVAQIKARDEQVAASEVALEGVKEEALVGSRTTLDVLDSEQEMLDARVALVGAQRDEVVAAYALLAAIGRMTAKDLGLPVTLYDPQINYDNNATRSFGWWIEETYWPLEQANVKK